MADPRNLKERAAKVRRLAASIADDQAAKALEDFALDLERQWREEVEAHPANDE